MNSQSQDGAAAPIETERKFRPYDDPVQWMPFVQNDPAAWEIEQGYLSGPGAETEVRCRRSRRVTFASMRADRPSPYVEDGVPMVRWQVGFKRRIDGAGTGALRRHEVEFDLTSDDEFESLRPLFVTTLRKVRVEYLIDLPQGGARFVTVDFFRDHLAGLRMAEIEFGDAADAASFDPPGFLGEEVTDDPRYLNAALAAASGPPA